MVSREPIGILLSDLSFRPWPLLKVRTASLRVSGASVFPVRKNESLTRLQWTETQVSFFPTGNSWITQF